MNSQSTQRGRIRRRVALSGFATALVLFALPAGSAMASGAVGHGGGSGTVPGSKAKLKRNGQAVPPASAPARVKRAIRAANDIAGDDYYYGGGHKPGFRDRRGYDCSGAASYALGKYGAKKLSAPMPSGDFMRWGGKGKGKWITTYANGGHMYTMIAGLRFESHTSGDGPSWSKERATKSGYKVRHPKGL